MIQAISFIFNLISLIWRPISPVSFPTFLFVKKQFSLKAIKHICDTYFWYSFSLHVNVCLCVREYVAYLSLPLYLELDLQCVFYHTTSNFSAFDSFSWLIPINESLMVRVSSYIQFAYGTWYFIIGGVQQINILLNGAHLIIKVHCLFQ